MVKQYTYEAAVERVWASIEVTGCCWYWRAALNQDGYGKVSTTRFGTRHAHRVVYSLLMQAPAGPELDHLCRVRACVNPDHLAPSTHKDNMAAIPRDVWVINANKRERLANGVFG